MYCLWNIGSYLPPTLQHYRRLFGHICNYCTDMACPMLQFTEQHNSVVGTLLYILREPRFKFFTRQTSDLDWGFTRFCSLCAVTYCDIIRSWERCLEIPLFLFNLFPFTPSTLSANPKCLLIATVISASMCVNRTTSWLKGSTGKCWG